MLARATAVGWAALLVLGMLVEPPVLGWTARAFGGTWFPTVRLALDGAVLAAAGWLAGRSHRGSPIAAVLAFAATLIWGDLDPVAAINVPWLIRLFLDALRDARYWNSLAATAMTHLFLFGSLAAGGMLSRPPRTPLSIVPGGKSLP